MESALRSAQSTSSISPVIVPLSTNDASECPPTSPQHRCSRQCPYCSRCANLALSLGIHIRLHGKAAAIRWVVWLRSYGPLRTLTNHVYNLPRGHSTIDPFRPFFRLTLFFPFNLPLPELTHATLWRFTTASGSSTLPCRRILRDSALLSYMICTRIFGSSKLQRGRSQDCRRAAKVISFFLGCKYETSHMDTSHLQLFPRKMILFIIPFVFIACFLV